MTATEEPSRPATLPIYTIGYGQRSIDAFIEVLHSFDITHLVDVRSQPHSHWKPQFNQGALCDALETSGIRYGFMGDQLGGRPNDPSCQRDGRVDYDLVRSRDWFQRGIERLIAARRKGRRIAVMCAEQKPERCHRFFLIAPELVRRGLPLAHIDEYGIARSHDQITQRLTGGQLSLLPADHLP